MFLLFSQAARTIIVIDVDTEMAAPVVDCDNNADSELNLDTASSSKCSKVRNQIYLFV